MPAPTKPTKYPNWATDTNFSSGPIEINATPTKVEPSADQKAQGDVPGMLAPAQWSNWWKNMVCAWVLWAEARLDGIGAGASCVRQMHMEAGTPKGVTTWSRTTGIGGRDCWTATVAGDKLYIPLHGLPYGAEIIQVGVRGAEEDTGDTVMAFAIAEIDADGAETTVGSWSGLGGGDDTPTTYVKTYNPALAVDPFKCYYLKITAGVIGDEIYGVGLTYSEGNITRDANYP